MRRQSRKPARPTEILSAAEDHVLHTGQGCGQKDRGLPAWLAEQSSRHRDKRYGQIHPAGLARTQTHGRRESGRNSILCREQRSQCHFRGCRPVGLPESFRLPRDRIRRFGKSLDTARENGRTDSIRQKARHNNRRDKPAVRQRRQRQESGLVAGMAGKCQGDILVSAECGNHKGTRPSRMGACQHRENDDRRPNRAGREILQPVQERTVPGTERPDRERLAAAR